MIKPLDIMKKLKTSSSTSKVKTWDECSIKSLEGSIPGLGKTGLKKHLLKHKSLKQLSKISASDIYSNGSKCMHSAKIHEMMNTTI